MKRVELGRPFRDSERVRVDSNVKACRPETRTPPIAPRDWMTERTQPNSQQADTGNQAVAAMLLAGLTLPDLGRMTWPIMATIRWKSILEA
jgi:hypothetical protein